MKGKNATMAQLPRVGDQFGRYRIDAQIGFGGMGVVFAATDLGIGRQVALKVVSAALGDSVEFLRRFEREAALLARLDSPHVIGIFDYGEHDGCPYIATQYVVGGDLGALIQARGPMPPALAVDVCAQVADALIDAHGAGVVHRDVKPSNVLLRDPDTAELHAYLCDFGIARSVEQGGLTAAGTVSGTWTYLAPECGSGQPATPASDIYAVGCLLWATLTGQPPYRGSDVEVAIAHQRAPVPQLLGDDPFSERVNDVLLRTLAKDPAERYPSADDLRGDLLATALLPAPSVRPRPERARTERTSPTPSGTPAPSGSRDRLSLGSLPGGSPPAPTRRRRTGWLVAAACLAVLGVVAAGVALTRFGPDDEPTSAPSADPSTSPTDAPTDEPTDEPTEPAPPGTVTGDRDGDGLGDLMAEWPGEDALLTWTSTGSSFEGPTRERVVSNGAVSTDVFQADLDGDGARELVRATYPLRASKPGTITATLADGSAYKEMFDPATSRELQTIMPGDVDGDGRSDLVISVWDQKTAFRFFVARSTDDGFTRPERWLTTTATLETSSAEVGDYDGDGRADVAVLTTRALPGYRYRSTAQVFRSNGRRFADDGAPREFPTGLGPEVHTGDVDGDGDAELVAVDVYSQGGVVPLHVLDYGDRLGPARVRGLASDRQLASTMVDVDGDGRDDVVQIVEAAQGSKKAAIVVIPSTGSRFAQSAVWATWTPRGDNFVLPMGATFP